MSDEADVRPEANSDGDRTSEEGLGELRRLLLRFGVHPMRQRGQNFLHDASLLRWIGSRAEVGPDDVVLEVGGGSGFLTRRLLAARRVVVVEIDEALQRCLHDQFDSRANVTLIGGDILHGKHELNRAAVACLAEALLPDGKTPFKCVSNLPYSVSVSFLIGLLRLPFALERAIVMVQSEVADRITASPGTRDYGAASVTLQSLARVQRIRKVPPTVFWPRPKVDSAILEFRPLFDDRLPDEEYEPLQTVLHAAFQHRRKRIGNALRHADSFRGLDAATMQDRLAAAGIDPALRADQLGLAEYRRLALSLSSTNP